MDENKTEVTQNSSKNITVQVPAKSIEAVRPLVVQLYQAAGVPLSRAVLADRLSTRVSSSGFVQKWASARYYGFIHIKEGRAYLTARGERFANGDVAAAQEGFMASAFGDIARGLAGRTADVATVALHLTEKKKVPTTSAERLAQTLLRSAREADLVSANGLDAARLEALQDFAAPAQAQAPEAAEQPKRTVAHARAQAALAPAPSSAVPQTTTRAADAPLGIELVKGSGFSLVYTEQIPVELITDPDFTAGLTSISKAIGAYTQTQTDGEH